jgi:hypothetical protein
MFIILWRVNIGELKSTDLTRELSLRMDSFGFLKTELNWIVKMFSLSLIWDSILIRFIVIKIIILW